jgi:hypothetical protein
VDRDVHVRRKLKKPFDVNNEFGLKVAEKQTTISYRRPAREADCPRRAAVLNFVGVSLPTSGVAIHTENNGATRSRSPRRRGRGAATDAAASNLDLSSRASSSACSA